MNAGLPAESSEEVQKAITSLENQRPWIGSYEHWRELGYPVGSGMIERAVSVVINRRMKKARDAVVQTQCYRHCRLAG